jgi:hypothetical protein
VLKAFKKAKIYIATGRGYIPKMSELFDYSTTSEWGANGWSHGGQGSDIWFKNMSLNGDAVSISIDGFGSRNFRINSVGFRLDGNMKIIKLFSESGVNSWAHNASLSFRTESAAQHWYEWIGKIY